jgi:hypothetical protein
MLHTVEKSTWEQLSRVIFFYFYFRAQPRILQVSLCKIDPSFYPDFILLPSGHTRDSLHLREKTTSLLNPTLYLYVNVVDHQFNHVW